MKQLSDEAQALIAQTRQLDEPTLGDRMRLRARLDTTWAATSAAPQVGASWLQGKLLLSASSFVAMASAGLFLVTTNPAPPAQPTAAPTQLAAASPPDTAQPIPKAEPEPGAADAPASALAPHSTHAATSSASPSVLAAKPSTPGVRAAKSSSASASRVASKRKSPQAELAAPVPGAAADARSSGLQAQREPAAVSTDQPPARNADEHPDPLAPAAIGDEVLLLGAAQKELRAGQPTRALGYIQQHAFRFPTGALAQERAAVQALALCALNRKTAARQVFEDLARRAPSAAVLPRIRRDCDF